MTDGEIRRLEETGKNDGYVMDYDLDPLFAEVRRLRAVPPRKLTDDIGLVFAALGAEILEVKQLSGWTRTTPDLWSDDHQVPADLALVHSEVSEALEAFRGDDRANFTEELADVLIRVVGLAAGLEVDLAGAVLAKLAQNRVRCYQHGGKRI